MLPGFVMVAAASLVAVSAPPVKKPPVRVGELFIVGNEVTPQSLMMNDN